MATLALVSGCGFSVGEGGVTIDAARGSDAPVPEDGPSSIDGPVTPTDGPINPVTPRIVANVVGSMSATSQLVLSLTVPTDARRVLIVAVQIGSNCPADVAPTVATVSLDNTPLARLASVVGTPCGAQSTRSEQWLLVAPASGAHTVRIVLGAQAKSIHAGAMVAADISQASPVRDHVTASGTGKTGSVQVASAPSDLVISTVGQGRQIVMPGAGTMLYLHNNSTSNTLDNSAASAVVATSAATTIGWTFVQDVADEWQVIATSLAP